MTTLNLDENQAKYQIRAYRPGQIKINDKTIETSVIVTPNQLMTDWAPQSMDALSAQDLAIIKTFKPNVLLIGTGEKHVLLPPAIYGDLINAGIGVEVMSTSAACRTFNALTAENRKVVAALLIK